jgi:hypothetical protein
VAEKRIGRPETHGGSSAIDAIRDGRPFRGLAAREEVQVRADLDSEGRAAMVQEIAVRVHTAARLYWAAVGKAAEDGDLEKLDWYCKRFGWLAASAGRLWEQVRREESARPATLDYDKMIAALARHDGESDAD